MNEETKRHDRSARKEVKDRVLNVELGDLLLSPHAFPSPDHIVMGAKHGKKPKLQPWALKEYLSFLELVVVQERIVVARPQYQEATIHILNEHPEILREYRLTGDLELLDSAKKTLTDAGVLYIATAEHETKPEVHLASYLPCSKKLSDELKDYESFVRESEPNGLADEIAKALLATVFGAPVYLAQFARDGNIPFLLSNNESEWLSELELVERRASRTVIGILKERLDQGAREVVTQLEELGYETPFPETPIATQILGESIVPEDLVDIALDLRQEYSGFRAACSELERELLDEHNTVKRRLKLLREVETVARELWPKKEPVTRKLAVESTALVGLVSSAASEPTVASAAGLVAKVLTFPVSSIIRALRRRRVRLLLKSRESFLASEDWTGKLSKMFELESESVHCALQESRQSPRR